MCHVTKYSYKCHVSVPETNFRLIQNKTDDDTVNVICAADGAFPAPNLTLATPERSYKIEDVCSKQQLATNLAITRQLHLIANQSAYIARHEECLLEITYFIALRPISTTPEMPTATVMQLASAIGSKGTSTCTVTALVLLPALAQSLLAVK
ncbi:unnamed protein product [Parnassius apollo]|uniref:(apollo) hypothetical protein n=1 Tax=Parnassius apollo TaxID=110799 RepID=A0A8S3XMP9_PARAO|nr:unnamed protein product [Parnassius apollo]